MKLDVGKTVKKNRRTKKTAREVGGGKQPTLESMATGRN